jgi:hypothetical protein
MKKILAILVLVLLGTMSYAQWSGGTGNQYLLTPGNVGIGTTSPSASIQVVETAKLAGLVLNTTVTPTGSIPFNVGQIDLRFNGTAGDFYRMALRKNMSNSHMEMLQTLHSSANGQTMNFLFVDLNAQKFQMQSGIIDAEFLNSGNFLLNNGGAVGIGMGATAIPAGTKLAIAGKVSCKEIEVTLTGLPDYVFNKDYKLRSLYDVESFVNENKHLPDVPSEGEVVKNGLNLGDMNSTLLKKVEELTLYMINLQKENDALKARISRLEK